jgi:hypothetical protein
MQVIDMTGDDAKSLRRTEGRQRPVDKAEYAFQYI